ncbi:MAG: hypothetical protein WC366_01815 [Bacilli bacterium]|jgi:hypothetical protein
MMSNEYGVRFTDQHYATKQEVAKTLNTQLIDNIWQNVLNYRSNFTRVLSLRNVTHAPFRITFSPTIVERINLVERKFSKTVVSFGKLENKPQDKLAVRKYIYSSIIKHLASKENVKVNKELTDALFASESRDYSAAEKRLFNYVNTLKNFEAHSADPLDENFFVNAYSRLTNNDELISLYRTKELDDSQSQRLLIGREYNSAPVASIPSMMDNLQDFLINSEQTFFVKAVAGFYGINLIKPFDDFNDEISVLVLKCGLSHGEIGDISALFPFEILISERINELKIALTETQRNNDLTYILVFVMDCIDEIVQALLDALTNYQIDAAKNEFRADEQIIAKPQETKVAVEPIAERAIKEEKTIERVDVPIEKPIPLKRVSEVEKIDVAQKTANIEFAIPKEMSQMDEKEAQKYEEYLLESEPYMKRGQAHFFARHCAVGKYYTIQQYKRSIGVVYETARTSMDALVKLGYYKKEQVKNKFVYTPLKRD